MRRSWGAGRWDHRQTAGGELRAQPINLLLPQTAGALASLQEAYAEAAADLAAEAAGKKGKRQKKGGAAAAAEAGDEEDAFFAALASQDRLPKFVELLKFRVGASASGVFACNACGEWCVVTLQLRARWAAAGVHRQSLPRCSARPVGALRCVAQLARVSACTWLALPAVMASPRTCNQLLVPPRSRRRR